MDKILYLKIRRGIEFFYFGNGCFADYNSKTISYLNEVESQIVVYATGENTIQEVVYKVEKEFRLEPKAIRECIERLINRGIVIARANKCVRSVAFHGEFGKYYPKELIIELTNQCNFYCPFCYKNASCKGIFISNKVILELDDIINGKINFIQLTGGEPTLHPLFEKYICLFSKYAQVSMVSNGSELYKHDNESIDELDMIQFSLYGNDDLEYKVNTGVDDGFTRLQKSVKVVKERGISYSISVTLCDKNIDKVEDYINTAIKLNSPVIKIGIADLFGREKKVSTLNEEYVNKKQALDTKLIHLKRKYREQINVILNNIEIDESTDELKGKMYDGFLKCGSGIDSLVISQNGKIRPCLYLSEADFDYGSVSELRAFIEGDLHKEQLRCSVKKIFNQGFFKENNVFPCWALEDYCKHYI